MPDARSAEDLTAMVVLLQEKLDDLESTVIPRLARRPTGDIEPTVRVTAKIDTLILNGALVARATYPVLWQWAQDSGVVISGLFTNGNGTTTFGLPDFRGRVPIGVGTLGSDTYALGALTGVARHTLTIGEIPGHDHGGGGTTSSDGGHSGHTSGVSNINTTGGGGAIMSSFNNSVGDHNHDLDIDSQGGGGAHENRQPSIAINWLIYT
jgi:microcystin-dependent protein